MKYNKVFVLAFAAIILAVVASGNASAMTPQASLVDSSNGLAAQWDNNPNNILGAQSGGTIYETDCWMYSSHAVSASTDAIYYYISQGTASPQGQITYANQFSQYGQGVTRQTGVTAGSSTGTYSYQISLGFFPHVSPWYTYFANPMKQETVVIS